MTIWNSTVPVTLALALLIKFFFVFHGLKTGFFFVIHCSLILFVTQIDFLPMTTVCETGETYIFAGKNKL